MIGSRPDLKDGTRHPTGYWAGFRPRREMIESWYLEGFQHYFVDRVTQQLDRLLAAAANEIDSL
jgi:hypothetical protein